MTLSITAISDLHGFYPELPGGDLLIIAGDLTARDTVEQNASFFIWLNEQQYRKKILIAGNHDGFIEKNPGWEIGLLRNFDYLQDSGLEFEGLKIWGSPWTPTFLNWHFMKDRGPDIKAMWDLIPNDIDILITHGPPYGILDKVKIPSKALPDGYAGCKDLREAVERIQPKVHIFGHIHEGYGQCLLKGQMGDPNTECYNVSIMNENYDPVNKPTVFEMKVKVRI